jgi:hypothetical protein
MQALPFALAAAGLLLAALFGARVKEIEILGVTFKPFETKGSRGAAGAVGAVCLAIAFLLAVPLPGPGPDPSPSPGPSAAQATATASAGSSPSTNPIASPSVEPTAQPTADPTPTPDPTATPTAAPAVAEWAEQKRAALEAVGVDLGEPSGVTLAATDGWQVQGFAEGIVYLKPEPRRVIAIYGPIFERWRRYLSPTERVPNLGYPVNDQRDDPITTQLWQRFDDGAIECQPGGPCFVVFGTVYDEWRDHAERLGYPTADVTLQFLRSRGEFKGGTVSVNPPDLAVCGSDGSTIEATGPFACGSAPPIQP